jgi:hypothetical protein
MNNDNKKGMGYGLYLNKTQGSKIDYEQPSNAGGSVDSQDSLIQANNTKVITSAQALGLMLDEAKKQSKSLASLVEFYNQQGLDRGAKIELPSNFANPDGSQSADLSRIVLLSAGSLNNEIFSFTAPDSTYVRFYRYAIFTDVLLAAEVEFNPFVNGNRTLQYHGNPQRNFALDNAIGVDLGENSLRNGDIYLEPGQTLTWTATNLSANDSVFGVRMVGYIDNSRERVSGAFGG